PLVVGERYVPGNAIEGRVGGGTADDTDAAPDASRVTPPTWLGDDVARVAFTCELVGVRTAVCAWPGAVADEGSTRTPIRLPDDAKPNADIIVRWPIAVREEALVLPDAAGGGGTIVGVFVPSVDARAGGALDVVVAVDVSGSMRGVRVAAAKRTASAI